MKELKVGVELEGIYNNNILKENVSVSGGYGFSKGSPINTFWKHTSDGSLRNEGEFESGTCAEIVQFPVVGRERFFTSLKAFQELANGEELKKFVSFNKSCGCHIHFSVPEVMYKNILVDQIEKMRENLFSKLKSSNLKPSLIEKIIKHYDRDYAKKIKKDDQAQISKGNMERRCELNVSCEREQKGIEWRAFNLHGITTWDEFYTLFNIAYDCLEDFIASLQKVSISETISVKTPKIPKPHAFIMTVPSALKRFKRCAI